jgi:ATP-grasp domain, R2K clade family 3
VSRETGVLGHPFRIVTHRTWLAKTFAEFGAIHDHGVDIDPTTALDTLWWAPGSWMACANKAGIHPPLLSCGPDWLGSLPTRYTGRRIAVVPLSGVEDLYTKWYDELSWVRARGIFIKLPEAKVESFEPGVRSMPPAHTHDTLRQHHFPEDTPIQVSEVEDFVIEARFFIAWGRVTAGCLYRIGDLVWDAEGFPEKARDKEPHLARMRDRVEEFLTYPRVPMPPGFVLDMGTTIGGHVLVVEANASWSSSPYTCDPEGVVRSILAAHNFRARGDIEKRWAWRPNGVFHKLRPLKLYTPTPATPHAPA